MTPNTFISLGLLLLFVANSMVFAGNGNNEVQTNQDSFDSLDHARMNSINAESAMLDNLADNENKTGHAEPKAQAKRQDKNNRPLQNKYDNDSTGRVKTKTEETDELNNKPNNKPNGKPNPNPKKPNDTPKTTVTYPSNTNTNSFYARKNVVISRSMSASVSALAREYFRFSGEKLIITSASRTPFQQASAMLGLIDKFGTKYVQGLYKDKRAVGEILDAYRDNRSFRPKAVKQMAKVIEQQIARNVYISRHLRSNALDVSRVTNEKALKKAIAKIGGSYFFERTHFHINLPKN